MHVCRFCHEHRADRNVIRYGRRHYACYSCYLAKDKPLEALMTHELEGFPWRLLKDDSMLQAKIAGILACREKLLAE